MKNIKLVIEYDGTRYFGWQKQPDVITVEGEIGKALEKLTGESIKLFGAGRTDRGVHARGQVANFYTESSIPPEKFKIAMNSALPDDISIQSSEEVEENFHSRYNAVGKKYKYVVYNNGTRSPLVRNYSFCISYKLDIDKMREAAKYFIGTHDFKTFVTVGSSAKTTVRTVHELSIEKNGDNIEFTIKGNGFLYNMVRIIVGTLIKVGNNKIEVEAIPQIIASQNRKNAGKTATAQGLYLEKVYYDKEKLLEKYM